MTTKKLINNVSALQFFQLIRFGTLLLISIVFTKTHLNNFDIGLYESILVITGAVTFFWISGIILSLLSIVNISNEKKEGNIFTTFIILNILSICAAILVIILKPKVCQYFNDGKDIHFYYIIPIYLFFSSPSNLNEYIYLLKNKANRILQYGVITFLLHGFFLTCPILLGYDIYWSLLGLVFISIIRYIWTIFLVFKNSKTQISYPLFKVQLQQSSPLIASSLLSGFASYFDDFLVSFKFNSNIFAVYKYGAKEFPLVLLLANSFSNAMIPEFNKTSNLNMVLASIKKKSTKMMHVLFPITILLLITSQWIYPKIFNPSFSESAIIFNTFLLLIISRLVFPQTILLGLKNTRLILMASLIELIIHISLSLVLISFFGILGIALATVIAFFAEKTILIHFCYNKFKIKPTNYINFPVLIIYSSILITAYGIYLAYF